MNKKLSDEFASLLTNIKAKGLLDLLSVNLFTQLISFGSLLLVVKFLSPEEYGEIKIIQSYTVFFIILAGFGFNTALLKLCSENRSDEEKEGILRLVVIRVGISSLISMVILFIFSSFGIITSSRNLSTWLIFYSLSIPFQVLAGVFLAYLQAKKRIREMARLQALIKILSVIIIIICTWIWGFKGFIIASVFAFAVSILPLIRVTGISFLNNRLLHIPLGIYNYAIYSFLANGMNHMAIE